MSTKDRNFFTALWDFFCSLKLTITTLILLATTSIIGTVVQQNLPTEEYLKVYGQTTYRVLDALNFFDMYHSWWFLGLLSLFSVNLLACSIKRLPRVWKTVREPVLVPSDGLFRTFSNVEELVVPGSVADNQERVAAVVGKSFAKPVITEGEDGKVHIFAQKGAYARFGAYVTHIGILIIFLGAILGVKWGFKAYANIVEGQTVNKVWPLNSNTPINLDFAVRCDKFTVTFYDGTQRPKEFKSLLTILKDGKPVPGYIRRPVIVNDPLTYKGITFYQASYGPAGNPEFNIRIKVRATGKTEDVTTRLGELVALPDGSHFKVSDFTQSFQNFGPAARIEVFPASGTQRTFVVLQTFPEFDAQRGGQYVFSLTDSHQLLYTGLQVAKDPGVWVVWFGCFLLVFGSLTAFFLSHRRMWVTLQPVGNKTGIKLGATAHRNQPAFEIFFDGFKKKFKNELTS